MNTENLGELVNTLLHLAAVLIVVMHVLWWIAGRKEK